ncbi:UbiA prenyltransferase family protein [Actinoplanes sp. RD1]|uniref:UbiA prenyltransferase family protein n=1 Tax=Actinoplanes sp. RD1 TaxID=3064538 RepID=UPI0027416D0D|nr:UbiA prenyltransferase family protein [Actinoplanes sp. RD1]
MQAAETTAPDTLPAATPALPALPVPRTRGLVRALVGLLRPGQWAKTFLVVPLPLLGAASWTAAGAGRVALAVAAFVLASGLVYVVNDISDRHRDREHPVKRHRPIASGRVPVGLAWAYAVVLAAGLGALLAGWPLGRSWPVLVYLALNLAYTRGLKHVPLVDVFIVSSGFLLRLAAGYVALGDLVSRWLLVAVLSLCLLLSLGKRRNELLTVGAEHRPALAGYTVSFVDQLVLLNAALTFMAYALYLAEAPESDTTVRVMLLSLPIALFALCRYLQAVLLHRGGGDPIRTLFRDRVLVACFLVWAALFVADLWQAHRTGTVHTAGALWPGWSR